jgi:hypothetical protein
MSNSLYVGFFHNPDYALLFTKLSDVTIVKMRNGSLAFQVVSCTNGKVKRYRDLSIARMQAKKHFGSETVFIAD